MYISVTKRYHTWLLNNLVCVARDATVALRVDSLQSVSYQGIVKHGRRYARNSNLCTSHAISTRNLSRPWLLKQYRRRSPRRPTATLPIQPPEQPYRIVVLTAYYPSFPADCRSTMLTDIAGTNSCLATSRSDAVVSKFLL